MVESPLVTLPNGRVCVSRNPRLKTCQRLLQSGDRYMTHNHKQNFTLQKSSNPHLHLDNIFLMTILPSPSVASILIHCQYKETQGILSVILHLVVVWMSKVTYIYPTPGELQVTSFKGSLWLEPVPYLSQRKSVLWASQTSGITNTFPKYQIPSKNDPSRSCPKRAKVHHRGVPCSRPS